MPPADDSIYRAAERRIEWLTLILGSAAAVVGAVRWGWRYSAGLALGAALAWVNFRWLKQGIDAMAMLSSAQGATETPRVPTSVYVKFLGRFALLIGVVYVILSRSLLPAAAVLAGFFALVAAVLIELVYQLFRSDRPPGGGQS